MPTRRYADALAEAGIGQTCAVDMQPADACVVSFRRDLCVAKKTVTFMELLWWFYGKAFLAHNMVLFDDDQWTSELVGFPSDRRPLQGHVHLRS